MAPRVIVVTGASSGIGRAAARQLAAAGDHLVLVARGKRSLDDAAQECDDAGAASTLVVAADVGDDEAVAGWVRQVVDRHGRIDAVLNCAGVVAYGRTEEVPAEVFERVLRTNLSGSANVARHVVPVLRRQRAGHLVLVGSVIGHLAAPSMSPYVVSKWGVRALARQLQLENRDLGGVHVSYLAPGGVDTPIYQQAANYDGLRGRPPPPVQPPERMARRMVRLLDRPRPRLQAPRTNDVLRFGFSALPALYDVLVGPVFRVAAVDRTRPIPEGPGNVLESQEDANRLHGDPGNAGRGILRNLVVATRERLDRRR